MKTVFVMGSLNMDLVIQTSVFPSCGETVKGDDFFTNPGGKGANQAVASARMGAPTWMIGAIGNDSYGVQLIHTLKVAGVQYQGVCKKESSSGIAVIILHQGENRILLHSGANALLTLEDIKPILTQHAKPGDILITQFETPLPTVLATVALARSLGMFIIVNPAPAVLQLPISFYSNVDVLIPNEVEAATLAAMNPNNFSAESAAAFFKNHGVKHVIITLGEKGCLYLQDTPIHIPAISVPVVDTTAAGDTFVGTLAASLSQGKSFANALHDANLSAAIAVSRKGAQSSIPTRQEMEAMKQTMELK